MCHYTSRAAALAVLVGALACSDRPPGTAPDAPPGAPDALSAAARPELLARSLALALGDPAFRAHVKAELDRSPFREHKLSFQRFLGADRGRALSAIAGRTGVAHKSWPAPPTKLSRSRCTSPFRSTAAAGPVTPTCWWRRRRRPRSAVAFDVQGNRQVLDPERPPATPVIALSGRDRLFDRASANHRVLDLWVLAAAAASPGAGRACT